MAAATDTPKKKKNRAAIAVPAAPTPVPAAVSAPAPAAQTISAEAYFQLEATSKVRHEYRAGELVEMPGGTPNHSRIILNLAVELKLALKKQPYDVFASDQRLWIPEMDSYVYPDVMVTRDPLELLAGRRDTVLNPVLVAEVLSRSTGDYDRGEKFRSYRSIESLAEFLLIGQDAPFIEHYVKTENGWLLQDVVGTDGKLALTSVPVELELVDLFDKVAFKVRDPLTTGPTDDAVLGPDLPESEEA
jgi:Uma2 family endonuclease